MSSAIGSVSSVSTMTYTTGRREMQAPPDPADMAKTLVSKMDSDGNGSINVKELVDAVSNTTAETATSSAATGDLFTALDSDGNGEVSESELSSTLQTISDSIARANAMGGPSGPPPGAGAMGGMPPPTSVGDSSGSAQPAAADTNGDRLVSQGELLAYYQSNGLSSSATADSASATAASGGGNSGQGNLSPDTMRTIMQLAQTYGRNESGRGESVTQALSVSA